MRGERLDLARYSMSTTVVTSTTAEAFEALWDAEDVAHYLKASRSWVYQKADSGILPSVRICGLLCFSPPAIRAYARGTDQTAQVVSLSAHTRG